MQTPFFWARLALAVTVMCEGGVGMAQEENMGSVAEVCLRYPERMQALFGALDLERDSLEDVRNAWEAGDAQAAGEALLRYYDDVDASTRMLDYQCMRPGHVTLGDPAPLLDNVYAYPGWNDPIPLDEEGGWDWTFQGPAGNDAEYGWMLNRHYHLLDLCNAYLENGDERYAAFIENNFQHWLRHLPPYPATPSGTPQWRGLEVAIRLTHWTDLFYLLKDKLSPATRLLMLATVPEHAHYNYHFHGRGNWLTMEMHGLAAAAAAWPEFRDADEWADKAARTLAEEMDLQFYPDGVQNELTAGYHWVAVKNVQRSVDLLALRGTPISNKFKGQIELSWDYLF
jgi:hypothetical protein